MCGDHWHTLQASALPSHLVCGSQSHNLLQCVAGNAQTGPSHWQDRENKYKAIRGTFPCPERAMASDLAIFFPFCTIKQKVVPWKKEHSWVSPAQCLCVYASIPPHHNLFTTSSHLHYTHAPLVKSLLFQLLLRIIFRVAAKFRMMSR